MKNRNPSAALIPGEAVVYAEVRNADAFISGLDKFMLKTGLSKNFGDMSLREFLDLMVTMSESHFSLDWFNLTKPAGIALLPDEGEIKEWENVIITLPLNPDRLDDKFELFLKELEPEEIFHKQVEDYLVLFTQPWMAELVPPSNGLDTSLLDEYAGDSLAFYVDIAAFKAAAGINFSELLAEKEKSLDGDSIGDEIFESLPDGFMDKYLAMADEIEKITFSLQLNETGFVAVEDLLFTPGGQLHDIGKKMNSRGQALEYLKYIPADSMFSYTSGVKFDTLIEEMEPLLRSVFQIYKIDEATLDEYFSQIKKMGDVVGPGIAFAYDFNLNFALIQQLSDIDPANINPGLLEELFKLDLVMVYDVKDKAKFWNFYNTFDYNGLIIQMMRGMEDVIGEEIPDMGFKLNIEQDLVKDGFSYDKISFDFDFSGLFAEIENPVERMMAGVLMDTILNQFNMYMHYSDGLYFGVMGAAGVERLKALVADRGLGEEMSLADTIAQSSLALSIPPESDMIIQISLVKIYDMIAGFPEVELEPLNLPNAPGIIGAIDVSGNRLHSVGGWGINEIRELINLLLPVIMQNSANLFASL